jgi:hypothetical protein
MMLHVEMGHIMLVVTQPITNKGGVKHVLFKMQQTAQQDFS